MPQAHTWTAQVRFHLEEQTNGTLFIVVDQQYVPDVPALAKGFLQLDLKDGVLHAEAERLVDLLNERVRSLAYTEEQ